jgi:formylglycine-generating enzyme required for sulfatase activity
MGIPTPVPPSDEQKSALVERIIRGELTPEQAQQRHGLTREELKDWVRIYRREARRAFDDRVKTVLSTQGIDIGDLAAAEFSGNVEDMSVGELLQTVHLGRKDAEIRIEQDRELSYIWCLDGHVVDAQSDQLRGAPAVYRLLGVQHGRIQADFSPVQRQRTIYVSTQALLMEGARRFDECKELRAQLEDTSAVFVPSDRSLAPDVQATSEQFGVLRLFDGIRNVDEVVHASGSGDLETLQSIVSLMDAGLLELVRSSRTSLREIPSLPPQSETPVESSFLPFAATLGAPQKPRGARRWVWALAAVGSATLGAALAVRFSEPPGGTAHGASAPQSLAPVAPVPGDGAPTGGAPLGKSAIGSPAPATSVAAYATCPDNSVLLGQAPTPAAPGGSSAAARGVTPYCMSRAEVTVAEYERCRQTGACVAAGRSGDLPEARLSPSLRQHAQQVYGSQCNVGQAGRENHPINCVTFAQANAYCAAAGGRLPTEAEWNFAARGSEGRAFPWGDAPPGPTRLNACGLECKGWYREAQLDSVFDGVMYEGDDGFTGTAPVASFPAGATSDGLFDLLGNVAEWTATQVDFGHAAPEDVAQAAVPSTYVVRGGSFSSGVDAEDAPSLRLYLNAGAHGRGVGFRCVYDPKTSP